MNFKINHIQIKFLNDKIKFLVEDKEMTSLVYDCKQLQNKDALTKKNFEILFEIIEEQIKSINKGSIFRPTLKMDVKYIENSKFSEIHKQFFTELGLILTVRNFKLIS